MSERPPEDRAVHRLACQKRANKPVEGDDAFKSMILLAKTILASLPGIGLLLYAADGVG